MKSFVQELGERQEMLDIMDVELAGLDTMGEGGKITYDSAKLGIWVQNLRNNLLGSDFDTLRGMVRRFVKRIEVMPDKGAEMTWDPEAILSLVDGPRVPATSTLVMKNGCGGLDLNQRPQGCELHHFFSMRNFIFSSRGLPASAQLNGLTLGSWKRV